MKAAPAPVTAAAWAGSPPHRPPLGAFGGGGTVAKRGKTRGKVGKDWGKVGRKLGKSEKNGETWGKVGRNSGKVGRKLGRVGKKHYGGQHENCVN